MRESEATIHEPTTPDHAAGGGRAADAVARGGRAADATGGGGRAADATGGGGRAADATGVWHACEDYATAEAL